MIRRGDALDLIILEERRPALIATDPPYAFGGSGAEHALSATVAIVLREAAQRLERGRSTSYMVEAVRGIVEPVRIATWCKPAARTKVETTGWKWASVNVIAFRKGKALDDCTAADLDHITEPPVMNGRRAELPARVAEWMVKPFAVPGGVMIDPFAGSGALVTAAAGCGMEAVGYEKGSSDPVSAPPEADHG